MTPLERFTDIYLKLDRDHLDLLDQIYSDDITFIDPAHQINGLTGLKEYFSKLYQNISHIDFFFESTIMEDQQVTIAWVMEFSHPRLANNQTISINGCSWLIFDAQGKAVYHRDYFDLGAMLYEQLPVLGHIVRSIKRRLKT